MSCILQIASTLILVVFLTASAFAVSGIYYGLGISGTNTYSEIDNKIYFYDFSTGQSTIVADTGNVFSDNMYSTIIGDKLFIGNVYLREPPYYLDLNGLYVLDLTNNSFYLYDRLPFAINSAMTTPFVSKDRYIYFMPPPSELLQKYPFNYPLEYERRVYRYDTITKESVALSPIPEAIIYGGIINRIGDVIYITTYDTMCSYENSIYAYDIQSDTFRYIATSPLIPHNMIGQENLVIGDKIYFVGGSTAENNCQPTSKVVEFDTSTNTFTIVANFSGARDGVAATVFNNELYVLGGERILGNTTADFERYDSIFKLSTNKELILVGTMISPKSFFFAKAYTSGPFDSDGDGIIDADDKCPSTIREQIVYGCSCEQILALKPGNNNGELKHGCSKGTIDVFTKRIGWARNLFN